MQYKEAFKRDCRSLKTVVVKGDEIITLYVLYQKFYQFVIVLVSVKRNLLELFELDCLQIIIPHYSDAEILEIQYWQKTAMFIDLRNILTGHAETSEV